MMAQDKTEQAIRDKNTNFAVGLKWMIKSKRFILADDAGDG